MAKAVAVCRCRICGQEFKKEAFKYNRREADSWKAWAEENINTCPACYRKEKSMTEKDGRKVIRVHYADYKANYDFSNIKTVDYDEKEKSIGIIIPEKLYIEFEVLDKEGKREIQGGEISYEDLDALKYRLKEMAESEDSGMRATIVRVECIY